MATTTPAAELPASITRLSEMDTAWSEDNPGVRLAAVRRAGMKLRQRILDSGRTISVRTFPVNAFPYPNAYGLAGAASSPAPYVILKNAMQLVQVQAGAGRVVNILCNPSDPSRSVEAPYFRKQMDRFGERFARKIFPQLSTVPDALASIGLTPEDIDFVTFDHLHTQDVRGLFGTTEPEPGKPLPTPALLPNAKLLVQRSELRTLEELHPLQARWYVKDGIRAVPRDRFLVLEGDYTIGGGFALVRTPGHTEGNHSLVMHTGTGLWTVSENGVAVECYAPMASKVPGVRKYARETGSEFILNSNTREDSLDQYISMALEKTLADPSAERPEFPQCFPSSEMVKSKMAPGLKPTFSHGGITWGEVRSAKAGARTAASSAA